MKTDIFFERIFARRSTVCFFLLCLMLLTCVLRVAVIASGDYTAVQKAQSSYKITVSNLRGTIYDCNMVPITNGDKKIYCAAVPKPTAVTATTELLSGKELENALETLKKNMPVAFESEEIKTADGLSFTTVYGNNEGQTLATHIIGYTDSQGHGVSGLEAAYDDLLYSNSKVSAVFTTDGKGNTLKGIEPYFENDLGEVAKGVVTTLDVNIQSIVEKAAEEIEKGAVLVADVKTNKIRASVSKPDFDTKNISDYLEDKDSPLMDRTLSGFSVGSAFKPCVAAAAIKTGKSNLIFNCTGATRIVDRDFKCHKREGHGIMDIRSALAQSCNTFFYRIAIDTGADAVYNMASSLSFGRSLKIAENIETVKGNITDIKRLSNPASLANLGIGQGDLLLSPVAMLNLYSAIAGNGAYYIPSIVEKTLKDGEFTDYDIGNPTRVMDENIAKILREYLAAVITEGTGTGAKPKGCEAAGKTATAQTGRYNENGIEINNSWFCGFFPLENPIYTVIVMAEESTTAAVTSVFSKIADGICELKY